MVIVEAISALAAPTAELALPAIFYIGEIVFWSILLTVELIFALFQWRKPKKVTKPEFTNLREKSARFADNHRRKRDEKSKKESPS